MEKLYDVHVTLRHKNITSPQGEQLDFDTHFAVSANSMNEAYDKTFQYCETRGFFDIRENGCAEMFLIK